jgi:ribosomal protein L31E
MSKKNIRSKRVQISFMMKKDPEEEFILNFLDSLSPSSRAKLIMDLLKKYVQRQMNKKDESVRIYAKLNDTENKSEFVNIMKEVDIEKTDNVPEEDVIIREIGETPKELKPEIERKNLKEDIDFENTLKIARTNIGLLNKSKK